MIIYRKVNHFFPFYLTQEFCLMIRQKRKRNEQKFKEKMSFFSQNNRFQLF